MSDEDDARTVFIPQTGFDPAPRAGTAPRDGGRLQPGDVLNSIFEVRRYITAGGMGEIWEGVNTLTDERVAIKVMLPHLAADANMQAMFRKEARTLTNLSHPALVRYRVLAMEPALGILYIVTDYIDGPNLQTCLREVPRDAASLTGLMRRLAEGLRAAHDLGAIHRDIAPDNVLLEGGAFDRARIIDFGIAKELDPLQKTIIGDGFAGKLGYVAPEQLGDFGREVGPWTDVYSLALVVLAVAGGKAPAMGATLVEAVDRRRAGVDLSDAPAEMRSVLGAMLEPDPARRLRDMAAVIAAIDRGPSAAAPAGKAAKVPKPPKMVKPPKVTASGPAGAQAAATSRVKPAIIAAAVAVLLAFGGGLWWALGSSDAPPASSVASDRPAPPVTGPAPTPADPVAAATAAVARALPGIACSWLEIGDVRRDGDGVSLSLAGVAGDPIAAQAALQRAIGAVTIVHDLKADVMQLPRPLCAPIEAYSAVRETGPAMLSVEKPRWEMDVRPDTYDMYQGQKVARVQLFIDPRVSTDNFTMVGWEESGGSADGTERAAFLKSGLSALPDGRLVNTSDTNGAGLKGVAIVRGRGPFDAALIAPPLPIDPGWRARFLKTAAERGWKVEMVWFQTQDLTPN